MIDKAEKAIGYTFKDKNLLKRALTLASASEDNNQLLEFFGDAILEFIVSEKIFSEGASEGELTDRRKSLVSDNALAPVSKKLGLDKLLIRGKNDTANKKAVPSAYEAVTAAIYLDGGMDAAKNFVLRTLDFYGTPEAVINYKGALQEIVQSQGQALPEYSRRDLGDKYSHKFEVTVKVFGKEFTGIADNAKTAEQSAARQAVEYYENQK
ncbi:MAG: hypothetical protein K2L12_00610 [Clostridia bacterium]|nr:hypothetical protein [Clostridia bacterium]